MYDFCISSRILSMQGRFGGAGIAECDESTRLFPMWPGFDSQTRRHMWVEFVGSLLCTDRGFSPGSSPLFPSP